MKEYIYNLILQFKQATGIKNVDLNSESFIKDFSSWIQERNMIVPSYQDFIFYLSAKPSIDNGAVEIGKGKFDSIAIDSGLSMITPYTDGIIKPNGDLIKGVFLVGNNEPLVAVKESKKLDIFSTDDFSRFITQNPYTYNDLINWDNLHNFGKNITVGVYGSIYDKDIEAKLKLMKDLETKLSSGYVTDYCTDRDNYMYVISSNRKIKEKILVKERIYRKY